MNIWLIVLLVVVLPIVLALMETTRNLRRIVERLKGAQFEFFEPPAKPIKPTHARKRLRS